MLDIEKLRIFLITAKKKGYAGVDLEMAKGAMITKDGDGSAIIHYSEYDWRYVDCYFGGEPFGGNEVVFYRGKAVWMMTYYGGVSPEADKEIVYPFLRRMLSLIMPEKPFRGPGMYSEGNLIYDNLSFGDITGFSGKDSILLSDKMVYTATYAGGLVNMQK